MKNQKGLIALLSHYLIPQRSNNHRPKILHPESLLILAIVVVGFFSLVQTVRFFPSLQNSILGYATNISIEDIVAQTNQQREKQGLSPLVLNSQLSAAALAKAQDMFDNQYWAHTSPQGKQPWDFIKAANYRYRVAGENLARDFYNTGDMVQAWMNSPTHKENILNGQYQQIGIAVVNGKLEGFETTLVVQMFGAPSVSQPVVSNEAAVKQEAELTSVNKQVSVSENELENEINAVAGIHNPVVAVAESNQDTNLSNHSDQSVTLYRNNQPKILSSVFEPLTNIKNSPVFSPLQLIKIVFLGVIFLVVLTLIYDSFVIGSKRNMRLVGQNLGHIILLICVGYLVFLFKGGVIK